MEKMAWDGPKWGREGFFPANPDLADILGDTDFDFENFVFFLVLDPKFQDFRIPDFQIARNLAWSQLGPSLGPALAQLGPSFWARLGPSLGPAEAPQVGRGAPRGAQAPKAF